MSSSFDVRRLRYFITVAELGSLTRAAEALHISQPALSQHVNTLESELGLKLLMRGPRGVMLTEAGQRMAAEGREVLTALKAVAERVKTDLHEPEGPVVIGVSQIVGSLLIAPLLELALKRLPRVRIQVREMLSGLLPEMARSNAVDFAISYNAASGNGIEATAILSEELCLVGQRRLIERHVGSGCDDDIPFRELASLPIYLSRRPHVMREILERTAKAKGMALNLVAEVDSLYIMKELALGGTGCCVMSRASVRREMSYYDLSIRRIVAPVIRRDICFLQRQGAVLPRAAAEVMRLTTEIVAHTVREDAWFGTLPAADPISAKAYSS
jgi:LysR family nitrogen assimilation transcriptional regulator